ncbi:MAG: nucleoside phosphorylase [Candidatus Heimdallarchaeota archaeon]|nr:nucleoside phosphorylase [Candidatus Heimdallarchaeota archaeon]
MARKKKVKTKTIDASNPQSDQGEQYHLKVKPGDLADIVLMPGDPKRVQKIAKEWETANKVAEYRQYVSYTGLYKGVPISSVSSGIGPSACEIAMLELKNVKVGNLIRVGSCGTLQKEIELGELIISEAAVRLEDTSKHYVMNEYPAVASRMVTSALIRACEENNLPYHVGVTASASSFYAGQGREVHNYLPSHQSKIVDDLTKAGVLNFEMEASLLFVLGSIFKFEVGAICAVYANRVTNEFEVKGEDRVINAANEGARILADYLADRGNKRSWY